jgi:hypothetical protein
MGNNTKTTSLCYYITVQHVSINECGAILCDCYKVSKILNIMTVISIFVSINSVMYNYLKPKISPGREKNVLDIIAVSFMVALITRHENRICFIPLY